MNILNKLMPQFKIKTDVKFTYNKINSIKPIKIIGLSLVYKVRKKVIELRKKAIELKIEKSNKNMTMIVPYRHREEHLKVFLPYIKKYLLKQKINYEIIVVEQTNELPFNKAKLMNIGAVNARNESEYFVFHDVDLLPENIDYRFCNFTEKLFYEIKHDGDNEYKKYKQTVLGGAVLVPKSVFFDINGYSNNYWQWGREDDDFFIRHILKGHVPLYDKSGKFKALKHEASLSKSNDGKVTSEKKILKYNKNLFKNNKKNYSKIKRAIHNQDNDGISTLDNYFIIDTKEQDHVRKIKVRFEE